MPDADTFKPFANHNDLPKSPKSIEVSKTDVESIRDVLRGHGFDEVIPGAFVRGGLVFGHADTLENDGEVDRLVRHFRDRVAHMVVTLTAGSVKQVLTAPRTTLQPNIRFCVFDDAGHPVDLDRGAVEKWPVRFFFAADRNRQSN